VDFVAPIAQTDRESQWRPGRNASTPGPAVSAIPTSISSARITRHTPSSKAPTVASNAIVATTGGTAHSSLVRRVRSGPRPFNPSSVFRVSAASVCISVARGDRKVAMNGNCEWVTAVLAETVRLEPPAAWRRAGRAIRATVAGSPRQPRSSTRIGSCQARERTDNHCSNSGKKADCQESGNDLDGDSPPSG
jgi:hypothetical protein